MSEQSVESSWRKIEASLRANASDVWESLNPPARKMDLDNCERALGFALPADLRAFYLLHNGQAADGPEIFDTYSLLSVKHIEEEWKVWQELYENGDFAGLMSDTDGATLPDWWNPAWIPFAANPFGDNLSIDLSPGASGTRGQLIEVMHDDASRRVIAPSFGRWLEQFASAVENS